MHLKICLAKKVLLFYAVIAPFIMYGSLYNLIEGVILHNSPTYRVGVFSLFGFAIMPFLLIVTYIHNKCVITTDQIRVGKNEYKFSEYDVQVREKELPFKERPITSLFKKNYYDLVVKKVNTNHVVLEKSLDVFKKDIENIKKAIPEAR
ncbi:hypothetical protein [Pedobacter nutrimenti]|uniref:PH (Pleckstrin Homology) domain-containing protein n=1 Tax=Pedobacter nutrimenti TaxID=1241337 RepID=A0A318UCH0_9SPHI|nr:hypothetical protein [Pedobacter nutrimenti]PYF74074.1 hypothetical protein B0O44_104245 [Pedobacter nutrimenti]